jgi:hypothetical protein
MIIEIDHPIFGSNCKIDYTLYTYDPDCWGQYGDRLDWKIKKINGIKYSDKVMNSIWSLMDKNDKIIKDIFQEFFEEYRENNER